MLLLEEAVVVVRHARDVHEAFYIVFNELDEQSKRRDAGNVAFVLVPDLVRHEADLLPLQQLALGIVRAPLHLGGMPGDVRKRLLELLAPRLRHRSSPRFSHAAMHDQVGIAADRGREMRVVLRREAEVPEAERVVPRLLHRSQHQRGNRALFRRAANPIDQLLEMFRPHRASGRAEAVAKRLDELFEFRDLLLVRRLVDAMQRGHPLLDEVFRHRLVRQQHELLDETMRDVALRGDDRFDFAVLRQDHFRLGEIEIDRAAPPATGVENLEQLTHQLEARDELFVLRDGGRIAVGQNGVDGRIGHPRVAVDHAVVHFIADDVAAAVDLHQT